MSYKELPFVDFSGGLILKEQSGVVQPRHAIDLLNVTFTETGAVRTRDGYDKFTTAEGTNRYSALHPYYQTDGDKWIIGSQDSTGDLVSILPTGAVDDTSTSPTAAGHYFTTFGGPTQEIVIIANGVDPLWSYNGTAFADLSASAETDGFKFVAITPWDNRLAVAWDGGSVAGQNRSSVRFSNPGDPTTFGANNYVDLHPGDGEEIKGMVAWREFLFVFKESKFFIFYGTGSDSSGNPVFNYRTVAGGVGMSSNALCAGREGVYFMGRHGVYVTTGGEAEEVSSPLEPFWTGGLQDFFQSSGINQAQLAKAKMTWHEELVYLSVPTGTQTYNDRVLVFDPQGKWWTLFDIPAAAMVPFRISDQTELVFAYSTGTKDLGRHSSAYSDDDGTAITSRWWSGWYDLGAPNEKTIRELKHWGEGQLFVTLAADFSGTGVTEEVDFGIGADTWGDGSGPDEWGDGSASDSWGGGTSLQSALTRKSLRGTVFSLRFQNVDATPWKIARTTNHLREGRVPSITEA